MAMKVRKKQLLWPMKWLILIVILILVSPIGLLVVWDRNNSWGEWDNIGTWTPNKFWHAPLQDYNLPGWNNQIMASSGYILSAFIGIMAVVIFSYGLSLIIARKNIIDKEK